MKVLAKTEEMISLARSWKSEGRTVGFVPTMGFLHEGHLSLVRESRKRADITVVSIYVNPTQFGPAEDFKEYPRDIDRDRALLEKEEVDCLFIPDSAEVYPPGYKTYVEVVDLQDKLCGQSRPGHFRGVTTVVLVLFNIVRPDLAFFGWKDAQQTIILRRMAADLRLGTRIVACPIVREPDGLAMSSRNTYLSGKERQAALVLFRSLGEARRMISEGERSAENMERSLRNFIGAEPLAQVEYIQIVDQDELQPLDVLEGDCLIALAVRIGKTRLIDNIRLKM